MAPPHAARPDSRTDAGLRAIHVASLAGRNGWRSETIGESAEGIPLVAWFPSMAHPTRVVWAAIHGEETVTLLAAHHLLRTVHADDACAVVLPVLNPDGVLAGTRQNARGVDLNRNFPGPTWSPRPSPTFWPTSMTRTTQRRTLLSSPGTDPGSEPEVASLMRLVERVGPQLVIDLHTPLECIIAVEDDEQAIAEHLAEPAGMRIVRELDGPTPGDSSTWCRSLGVAAVTYEFELTTMPLLWHRHGEALTRCVVERRTSQDRE